MASKQAAYALFSWLLLAAITIQAADAFTPVPDKMAAIYFRLANLQGQERSEFNVSEPMQLKTVVRNYNATGSPNAITIVQVRGLEDEITHYLAWQEGRITEGQISERAFQIPAFEKPGQYIVIMHIWSDLENPQVQSLPSATLLKITATEN